MRPTCAAITRSFTNAPAPQEYSNTPPKGGLDYTFALLSFIGSVLCLGTAYLTYDTPPTGTYLDPAIGMNTTLGAFLLYGAGFLFAPKASTRNPALA